MAIFEKLKVFEPKNNELVTIFQNVNCPTGSTVINDEFHDLFVSVNGTLHGPLCAGRYSIDPRYSPFFTGIRNFPTGGRPAINVSIFYVSKQNYTQQFGTGEIVCNETILQIPMPIRVAAGGTLIFKVINSRLFLKSLVGLSAFNVNDLSAGIRALILPTIRDALAHRLESENFAQAQPDLQSVANSVQPVLENDFRRFGLSLTMFGITCFNINQADIAKIQEIHDNRLKKATEIEAAANEISTIYGGNVRDRARMEALLNFSRNQGNAGSISQLAMLPVLMNIGREMSENMGMSQHAQQPNPRPRTPRRAPKTCRNCARTYDGSFSFCPYCGHQSQ